MRFLNDISIERAIAHHLDHLLPEKIISHRPLKLTEELRLYLSEHIVGVSRLSSLIPAKFKEKPGEVALACRAILEGGGRFTNESIRIAEKLFAAMGTNRTFSPGLLVMVHAKNIENHEPLVALLKLESQPVFKEERKKDAEGELYIELAVDPVALPSPGRHLQKCALIKAEHTAASPEVLLLDKQARDAGVAGFFHEHFLEAEYCRDSHFRTKKFMREFVKWANKARYEQRLSPDELDQTIGAAKAALRQARISLPDFVEKAVENRGEQHDCLETLTRKHVEPKFETEEKASERFRKISVVKLDQAAQIRMPQSALLDKSFYRVEPDPSDPTMNIITIRSRKDQVG